MLLLNRSSNLCIGSPTPPIYLTSSDLEWSKSRPFMLNELHIMHIIYIFSASILIRMSHKVRELEFVDGWAIPGGLYWQRCTYILRLLRNTSYFDIPPSCKKLFISTQLVRGWTKLVLRCECSTTCTSAQTGEAHLCIYGAKLAYPVHT